MSVAAPKNDTGRPKRPPGYQRANDPVSRCVRALEEENARRKERGERPLSYGEYVMRCKQGRM